MKIALTQGKHALFDKNDYALIKKYKWYPHRSGNCWYATAHITKNGKESILQMHRLIMDAPKGKQIDHINHNGLDNRRKNLRICTKAENIRYQLLRQKAMSSPFKGVAKTSLFKGVQPKKKWRSYICVNSKLLHLGCFETETDAARAYNQAALKYFNQFAFLNPL